MLDMTTEDKIAAYNTIVGNYNSETDPFAWFPIDDLVRVALHSVGRTPHGNHLAIWGVGTDPSGRQTLLGFHFRNDTECHYIMIEADGRTEETVFPFAPNTNAGAVYTAAKTVENAQNMDKDELIAHAEKLIASAAAEMN